MTVTEHLSSHPERVVDYVPAQKPTGQILILTQKNFPQPKANERFFLIERNTDRDGGWTDLCRWWRCPLVWWLRSVSPAWSRPCCDQDRDDKEHETNAKSTPVSHEKLIRGRALPGLQGTDRVDLCDVDDGAHCFEGSTAAFSHLRMTDRKIQCMWPNETNYSGSVSRDTLHY